MKRHDLCVHSIDPETEKSRSHLKVQLSSTDVFCCCSAEELRLGSHSARHFKTSYRGIESERNLKFSNSSQSFSVVEKIIISAENPSLLNLVYALHC